MSLLTILLGLGLATTPVYMMRLTFAGVPFYLPELFLLLALVVWLALVATKKLPVRFPNGWLLGSVFVFLLGAAISTLQGGQESLGALKSWVLLPALFGWLAFQVMVVDMKAKQLLKNALAVAGVIVSGLGIIEYVFGLPRLESVFNSPNSAGMWLVPTFFVLLPHFRSRVGKLVPAIILLAILLTKSFGALMAFGGGLVILVLVILLRSKTAKRVGWGVLALGFLGLSLLSLTRFLETWLDPLFGDRLGGRLQIWQVAQTAIKDHLLAGIGPGRFESYYLSIVGMTFANPIEWNVPQPHNFYLATWLESGLVGSLGMTGLVLSLFYFQLKNRQPYLLAALAAILIHGLVDTTYWKNDLAVIFFFIVALVAAREASQRLKES